MKRNEHTITINKITDDAKKSLKTRIISAVLGLVVVMPLVIMGDWFYLALAIFVLGVAVIEIIKCAKKKYSRWCYLTMFLLCFCIMLWPIFRNLWFNAMDFTANGHIYPYFDSVYLSVFALTVSIFLLFFVIMCDENFSVRDASFLFTIGVLISLGLESMLYLRFTPLNSNFVLVNEMGSGFYNLSNTFGSLWLFIYLLIAVFATDTGAYFTGMLLGHKKINPRISPKKTWAGFFGGLIFSTLLSASFALILAANDIPILPKYIAKYGGWSMFDLNHWYNILILSILIPPFATLGDFVFSAIKRYYDIKDFGHILPGHGGVLDRCDSLLFASIVAALYIAIGNGLITGNYSPLL